MKNEFNRVVLRTKGDRPGTIKEYHSGGYTLQYETKRVLQDTIGIDKKIEPREASAKKKCYANEKNAFISLKIVMEIFRDNLPALEERAHLVKGLYRDVKLLQNLIQRVIVGFIATITDEQQINILRNMADSAYCCGARRVSGKTADDEYGYFLTCRQSEILFNALKSHCLVCPYDSAQAKKKCELRDVLDELSSDPKHDSNGCGYELM